MTRTSELLADMAANPPRQRYVTGTFGPNDGALIYDDERVKELRAIHKAEAKRLFVEADQSRDYSAFEAHVSFTVQNVIEGAVSVGRCTKRIAA